MRCVVIGFGCMSKLHIQKLIENNIDVLGVFDKDDHKKRLIRADGFEAFSSYKKAFEKRPDFWDVCVPTQFHLESLESIVSIDPEANIIMEKPICLPTQINRVKLLLRKFNGKIVIGENYKYSKITKIVKKFTGLLSSSPTKIISEMSKNRTLDFKCGRFSDENLFALGYEGTHLLTNVLEISESYIPAEIMSVKYKDMVLENEGVKLVKKNQGEAKVEYFTKNRTKIVLYTSLTGDIGNYYSMCFKNRQVLKKNHDVRYRILAIENANENIVGFYPPLPGMNKTQGSVFFIENGKIKYEVSSIQDDTLDVSIKSSLKYFNGYINNPNPIETGIQMVEWLNHFVSYKETKYQKTQ